MLAAARREGMQGSGYLRQDIRRHQVNLDLLRHLAQEEHVLFSDDESDGVEDDQDDDVEEEEVENIFNQQGEKDNRQDEEEDIDIVDTILVPYTLPKPLTLKHSWGISSSATIPSTYTPRQEKHVPSSPYAKHEDSDDESSWTLVDKSPTFENVRAGKTFMADTWSKK